MWAAGADDRAPSVSEGFARRRPPMLKRRLLRVSRVNVNRRVGSRTVYSDETPPAARRPRPAGQPLKHSDETQRDAAERYAAIFVEQRPGLRRLVAGMGFGAADADDILQDVFVEASQRPGEFRDGKAAQRWLAGYLQQYRVAMVVYERGERPRPSMMQALSLTLAYENGTFGVYAVGQ